MINTTEIRIAVRSLMRWLRWSPSEVAREAAGLMKLSDQELSRRGLVRGWVPPMVSGLYMP